YLIINRVKPEMVKRGDMLSPEDIMDILAIDLIGLVPEDDDILVSTNRGAPAAMNQESNRAGRAFMNIAHRLMGETVPFLSIDDEPTWFQRLLRSLGLGGEAANHTAPANQRRPAPSAPPPAREEKPAAKTAAPSVPASRPTSPASGASAEKKKTAPDEGEASAKTTRTRKKRTP